MSKLRVEDIVEGAMLLCTKVGTNVGPYTLGRVYEVVTGRDDLDIVELASDSQRDGYVGLWNMEALMLEGDFADWHTQFELA